MDFVSSILDIVIRLFDCTVIRCSYIRDLEKNLKSLSEKNSELEAIYDDVKTRVETEEKLRRKRKKLVEVWLHEVGSEQKEVDVILQKGNQEIQKKCLASCFTKNCYSSYKIGKKVEEKISRVTQLISRGEHFENIDVTSKLPPPLDKMPTEETVGMDSKFDEVWRCIEDQSKKIIGLYGMGGVGKTTLLKKLNNKFLVVNHLFDLVIWVAVSKEGNLDKIQEAIRKKLDISESVWKLKDDIERAGEIARGLERKKFVLLLDDVWERLDLLKIGVTLSDSENGSSIVFTTRSEEVCGLMEASRTFKVECLSPEAAMELFRNKVGGYVFKSHPEIPMLAQVVVEECKGLPLALITIARAMYNRSSHWEWQYAIEQLRSNPARFEGIGDLVFPNLRFSYDSLTDDTLKKCFLYCSLFPEEHNIRKDELIDLWIGEGFLKDFLSINGARGHGEHIIGSLKFACLIETGAYSEDFVKMHDVIRDMALMIASDDGNKILVQRSTDPTKESAHSWSEARRLSLWGSSMESLPQVPYCPHLQTLLVRFTVLDKFPLRFLESMSALEVLDLSYNLDLTQLPAGIGALINLRYLNLSVTSIHEVPTEIMYLKNLKILLLDGMLHLLVIPAGVISSLSSLQVFSLFTTEVIELRQAPHNDKIILDELMSLENIDEISFTVCSVSALSTIMESVKLGRRVKRLTIMLNFELSSVDFLLMERLETLNIVDCSLRSINVKPSRNPSRSSHTFFNLHHLYIHACPVMIDLRWVIEAPMLEFLSLKNCDALSEIIGGYESVGSSEIEHNYLSWLRVVELESLPSLTRICYGTMRFLSLETLSVTDCPNLRNLPFHSESVYNCLKAIRGSAEWWEQLQWENQFTKGLLAEKFIEL